MKQREMNGFPGYYSQSNSNSQNTIGFQMKSNNINNNNNF